MNHLAEVPVWVAIIVSALALLGSFLALVGTIGLVRLDRFFERLHAPTLGASWGTGAILLASIILFSVTDQRVALHELMIGVMILITSAVTMVTLAGSALQRKPPADRPDDPGRTETIGGGPGESITEDPGHGITKGIGQPGRDTADESDG